MTPQNQQRVAVAAMIGTAVGALSLIAFGGPSAKELYQHELRTPILNRDVVRGAQNTAAEKWPELIVPASILGVIIPPYLLSDVDGDPSNPRWMAALAQIQVFINRAIPTLPEAERKKLPTTSFRTDGVLDNATLIALRQMSD